MLTFNLVFLLPLAAANLLLSYLIAQDVVPVDAFWGLPAWLGPLPALAIVFHATFSLIAPLRYMTPLRVGFLSLVCLAAATAFGESQSVSFFVGGLSALVAGALLASIDVIGLTGDTAKGALATVFAVLGAAAFMKEPEAVAGFTNPIECQDDQAPVYDDTKIVDIIRIAERLPQRSTLRIPSNPAKCDAYIKTIRALIGEQGGEVGKIARVQFGPYLDSFVIDASGIDIKALRNDIAKHFKYGSYVCDFGGGSYQVQIPAERTGIVPIKAIVGPHAKKAHHMEIALGVHVDGEPLLVDMKRRRSLLFNCRNHDEIFSFCLTIGLGLSIKDDPLRAALFVASEEAREHLAVDKLDQAFSIAFDRNDFIGNIAVFGEIDRRTHLKAQGSALASSEILVPIIADYFDDRLRAMVDHILRYGPEVGIYPIFFSQSKEKDSFHANINAHIDPPQKGTDDIRAHLLEKNDYALFDGQDYIRFHGPYLTKGDLHAITTAKNVSSTKAFHYKRRPHCQKPTPEGAGLVTRPVSGRPALDLARGLRRTEGLVVMLDDQNIQPDTGVVQGIPFRHLRINHHTDGSAHAISFIATPTEGAAPPDSDEPGLRREKIR